VTSAEPAADRDRLWGGLPAALADVPPPDSVEIKVVVADGGNGVALAALAARQPTARRRRVYLLDTPAGDLRHNGLVVRLRSTAGRSADVVVKWRPNPARRPDASELSRWRRAFPHLRTELDALPHAATWSAVVGRNVRRADLDAVVRQERNPKSILVREQRRLIRAVAPAADLGRLCLLGPVCAIRARLAEAYPGHPIVAEVWQYPDGTEIVEVSARCPPRRVTCVASTVADVLARDGLLPARHQRLKTDLPLRPPSPLPAPTWRTSPVKRA
jgi:hypothetical protein